MRRRAARGPRARSYYRGCSCGGRAWGGGAARLPPPLAAAPLALAPRERACGEEHGEVEGGVRAAARSPGPTGPQLLSQLQLRGRAWGGGAARTPRAVNSAAVAPLRMREFNACG